MFVTKKKFEVLVRSIVEPIINRVINGVNEGSGLTEGYLEEIDDKRKNGDDALSKIIERNREYVDSACAHGDRDSAALEERLREAETRIDNLIESSNDAAERHNHNIYKNNQSVDKCNARFAEYESQIENLAAHSTLLAERLAKLDERTHIHSGNAIVDRAAMKAVLAVDFEWKSLIKIGKTFWLKVSSDECVIRVCTEYKQPIDTSKTVQGTWNGLFFDLPDGKRLPHEYVLEVGDEIETPEL